MVEGEVRSRPHAMEEKTGDEAPQGRNGLLQIGMSHLAGRKGARLLQAKHSNDPMLRMR
jgi:hypothetical protein